MVEYSVILKRHKGSSRPDVLLFRDEDREKALAVMQKYVKQNGFTVQDHDGRFTISTLVLEEKEPIYGAPVVSSFMYHELFDHLDNRRKEEE